MAKRPPRRAATVALVADGKTLMLERARTQRFLGGFHGFPGGGIDKGDGDLPADSGGDGGKRACALRELFEETGLLIVAGEKSPLSLPEEWARLNGGELGFARLLEERGLELATSRLVEAGNWLTPEFSLLRFDTYFYIVAVEGTPPIEVKSKEAARCEWIEPREALRRWRNHDIMMVPPTLNMLRALSDGKDVHEWAERACGVPQARAVPERRIESRYGIIIFPMRTRTLPPSSHTNTILFGEGEMIVIDPGSPEKEEQDALLDLIGRLRGEGREAKEIVLTHHHPDHVGAVERLRAELALPVAAHDATALLLRGEIRVNRALHDGDTISLGGENERVLEVLHTPGHAPGHLAFYERATRTLLSGDNVLGYGSVLINPPHGNMDDYLRSLERMKRLDARCLIGGHGEAMGDPAGHIERFIDHRLEREREILGAILDGPRTAAAIVKRVYTDVPDEVHPLAERSVLAHLERLVGRGLAEEAGGRYEAADGAGMAGAPGAGGAGE